MSLTHQVRLELLRVPRIFKIMTSSRQLYSVCLSDGLFDIALVQKLDYARQLKHLTSDAIDLIDTWVWSSMLLGRLDDVRVVDDCLSYFVLAWADYNYTLHVYFDDDCWWKHVRYCSVTRWGSWIHRRRNRTLDFEPIEAIYSLRKLCFAYFGHPVSILHLLTAEYNVT